MVVSDTDVLIAAIRNNEMAKNLLKKHGAVLSISVITAMELYAGAKKADKKLIILQVIGKHEVLSLSKSIGETALKLMKEYNNQRTSLHLADALIAATCLEHRAALLTFNTKDFQFIKGLKLAK